MRTGWMVSMLLVVVLAVSASSTVASRLWMQESHRKLSETEKEYRLLLVEEEALQVEWVFRTDLNSLENRARQELGMVTPTPDQWQVIPR
ncbi:MAG: cell division protein FtsL [Magnetococcus sp. WYHC-3]